MRISDILKNVDHWFEDKAVLHIGTTTGKPGHWIAHPLCGKRLKKWIGFDDLKYAKTDEICGLCFLLHIAKQILSQSKGLDQKTEDNKK